MRCWTTFRCWFRRVGDVPYISLVVVAFTSCFYGVSLHFSVSRMFVPVCITNAWFEILLYKRNFVGILTKLLNNDLRLTRNICIQNKPANRLTCTWEAMTVSMPKLSLSSYHCTTLWNECQSPSYSFYFIINDLRYIALRVPNVPIYLMYLRVCFLSCF